MGVHKTACTFSNFENRLIVQNVSTNYEKFVVIITGVIQEVSTVDTAVSSNKPH